MGKLTFSGGWGRVGGGRRVYWGDFPRWENAQIFSWWEGPPKKLIYIYIYTIVPACVLISLANHNSAIFSVPQATEKLNKLPQAHKKP